MRRLIVTADDFGLATEVNEAVERAHLHGILSAASLMVAAPASGDAIERARRLPTLRVGLHLVLVNGRPALPAGRVPHLVDSNGRFPEDLFKAGVRYFFSPAARRELEAEIREQFRLFADTGLSLDHVNAQNHMHVHPAILSLVMTIGRDFGMRAVRVPYEPFLPSWRAAKTRFGARAAQATSLAPWLGLMRARLRHNGFATNDYVFGMIDTGRMTAEHLRALVMQLPDGVSEVYSHPAVSVFAGADPPHADYAGEFSALTDPLVFAQLRASNVTPVSFTQLADAAVVLARNESQRT